MTPARDLIDTLAGLEPIKTWSLIVTLFGDATDTDIPAGAIRLLLDHIGIQPGATRVALHRLKGDGWIVATKAGREVNYALSEPGAAETHAVYRDIYSSEDKFPNGWILRLINGQSSETPLPANAIPVSKDCLLMPAAQAEADSEQLNLPLRPASLPSWLTERLIDQHQQALAQRTTTAIAMASQLGNMPKIDRAAIRLLILHHWRKLALRPASWAHVNLCPDGAVAQLHRAATHYLANTDPVEMTGLDEPA